MAMIIGAANEAAKGLFEPKAGQHVIILCPRMSGFEICLAGFVENRWTWPWYSVIDHQSEGSPRDINAISHRIGAKQAGVLFCSENIDQSAGVERVNMLGKQHEFVHFRRIGETLVDLP